MLHREAKKAETMESDNDQVECIAIQEEQAQYVSTFSGDAIITDSMPLDKNAVCIEGLMVRLDYKVKILLHLSPQRDFECGYRAVVTMFVQCSAEGFCALPECGPDGRFLVKFFNKLLCLEDTDNAKALSNIDLNVIVRRVHFLQNNFFLTESSFAEVSGLWEVLKKIELSFITAGKEQDERAFFSGGDAESPPDYDPLAFTIKSMSEMMECVHRKTKSGKFKDLLERLTRAVQIKSTDYSNIVTEYRMVFESFQPPEWFDGTFTVQGFQKHIVNERNETDRPLTYRGAIVNVRFHWINVTYRHSTDQQRQYLISKAF